MHVARWGARGPPQPASRRSETHAAAHRGRPRRPRTHHQCGWQAPSCLLCPAQGACRRPCLWAWALLQADNWLFGCLGSMGLECTQAGNAQSQQCHSARTCCAQTQHASQGVLFFCIESPRSTFTHSGSWRTPGILSRTATRLSADPRRFEARPPQRWCTAGAFQPPEIAPRRLYVGLSVPKAPVLPSHGRRRTRRQPRGGEPGGPALLHRTPPNAGFET